MADNVCVNAHKKEIMAVHDAMHVLSGKWKISVISSICYHNKRRFSDILNDINGISNKFEQRIKRVRTEQTCSTNGSGHATCNRSVPAYGIRQNIADYN